MRDLEAAQTVGVVGSMRDFAEYHSIPLTTLKKWKSHDLEARLGESRGVKGFFKGRQVGLWPESGTTPICMVPGLHVAVEDVQENAMNVFQTLWDALPAERRHDFTQARPILHKWKGRRFRSGR